MKKNMLYLAAFAALLTAGCRKIEADGEKEIVVVNGGGASTTGQTITLQGRINADTLLRKQNTYILKGLVYMVGNHTMTIEPGTVIKGSYSGSDVAALIITRGSKIMAQGTASEPVVFTSASPNPQSGDWGGIILCGKAPINTSYNNINGLFQVEGGVDNATGDGLAGSGDAVAPIPVPNDNSGVLSYVRIEYAGYAFQPDKEINSLTMAAVGSGTTIDHVQTTYAKDDALNGLVVRLTVSTSLPGKHRMMILIPTTALAAKCSLAWQYAIPLLRTSPSRKPLKVITMPAVPRPRPRQERFSATSRLLAPKQP